MTCLPFQKKKQFGPSPLGGRPPAEVSASRKSHESGRARHLQRPVRSFRQHPVNLPEACAVESGFWLVTTSARYPKKKLDEFNLAFRCQLLAFLWAIWKLQNWGEVGHSSSICFLNGPGKIPNLTICFCTPCIQVKTQGVSKKTRDVQSSTCEIESPWN